MTFDIYGKKKILVAIPLSPRMCRLIEEPFCAVKSRARLLAQLGSKGELSTPRLKISNP